MTQYEKILKLWVNLQSKEKERFIFPYEVIGSGDCFVGYKAPTRFCEMCLDYPDLIETKIEGKYRVGRLKLENIGVALTKIPPNLCTILVQELTNIGLLLAKKY